MINKDIFDCFPPVMSIVVYIVHEFETPCHSKDGIALYEGSLSTLQLLLLQLATHSLYLTSSLFFLPFLVFYEHKPYLSPYVTYF